MAYVSENGIILRRREHFDTDQLISLFTPSRGVLQVRVPHGQKSQKTHCGRLEPPNHIRARLYQSREDGPWTLSESELVGVHAEMMADEELRRELWPLLSLYSDLFPEGQPPGPSYQRFLRALDLLKQGFRPALLVSARLLVKTAQASGVVVDPESCRQCGVESSDRWSVAPETGLLCSDCASSDGIAYPIEDSVRQALLDVSRPAWSDVKDQSFRKDALENVEVLLYRLFHYHFEISLDALKIRQTL